MGLYSCCMLYYISLEKMFVALGLYRFKIYLCKIYRMCYNIFKRKVCMKKKSGGQIKLNKQIQDKLVKSIAEGNYYATACANAGIHFATMRRWIIKGEDILEKIENEGYEPNEEEKLFCNFCDEIKKAESEAEMLMVKEWKKHMPDNWQSIATFMERRYPDKWGRQNRLEVTGKDGNDISIKIIKV